jgi:hypothetical protein
MRTLNRVSVRSVVFSGSEVERQAEHLFEALLERAFRGKI